MLADLARLKSLIEVKGGEKEEWLLRAQNADQLLTQFVVFHDADPQTRIPLGAQWAIRRFAELKRGKLEREWLRKSLVSGLTKAFLWVLLVAAVTMVAAAVISVREEFEATRDERRAHGGGAARGLFAGRTLAGFGGRRQQSDRLGFRAA